ncbi:MAG: hypothetical protein K5754_05145 [Butyrivibrio sp.]|nr:hypothetical protein [Butyrivibrio sp.]
MKAWNTPVIETLEINETAAGGRQVTSHDGNIRYNDGIPAEEYLSGPVER